MEPTDTAIGVALSLLVLGFFFWLHLQHKKKAEQGITEEAKAQAEPLEVDVPLRVPDTLIVREKYVWPHGKADLVIGEAGQIYWATQEIWAKLAPGRKYSVVTQQEDEDWLIIKILSEEKL
jgi:hypothetical protein